MNIDAEKLVWQHAWHVYGESLGFILQEALAGYRRASGFDQLTRFYDSVASREVLRLLTQGLLLGGLVREAETAESYVEIRFRLRSYLAEYLLRKLLAEHQGTPELRDVMFAVDLGV